MNTLKKCIVTGGAGFIGSHLCDLLLSRGYEVICVDNLLTGSKINISHLSNNPEFHFVFHDISKPFPSTINRRLPTINYLYHLASAASPPQYRKYSIETLLVNSAGTHHTLELARRSKAAYLIASTSEVYGDPLVHPQNESYFGNVNPVGLRACYDEGKRFSEALVMEYFRKHKLNIKIARIFNTYGPRMQKDDGRAVSNFVNQAIEGRPLTVYGSGVQTRSFCYISDMVEGLVTFMENKNLAGEIVNLGNPDEYSIKAIAQLVLHLTKSKSALSFEGERLGDDPQRRKPDISKAQKLLGWTPKIGLEEGILKTIEYFKSV